MAGLSVIAKKPTLLDFGVVERGITAHSNRNIPRERAFLHYVLASVFGIETSECAEHIVDGAADRGIDLVFIDHENRKINIGSCKTVASYKNSLRAFPGVEVDKIISFVDDLMFRREDIYENANGALISKINEIWEILGTDPYTLNVHLFSNQLTLIDSEKTRLSTALNRHNAQLFEHGLYEIAHGVVRAARPNFRKKISPLPEQFFTVTENGHRGFATRVTLKELFSFLKSQDRTKFDDRLLDQNVRYFLELENAVNQEIKNTLVAGNPHDFWFLNNGITIVADQIITVGTGCHPISLVNPQIVNGGQTAKIIFYVGQETLAGIASGSVALKLIESSDRGFIEKIAIASNTQSRIFGRDLRANDQIQTKLASAINSYGFFYKRKRGEEIPRNCVGVIDAGRAGQLILSYVHGDPAKSKTDSNAVFEDLYTLTFDPNVVTAEVIISAHKIHQAIEKKRQQAAAWRKSLDKGSFAEHWLIEGHFHVLFVVGELLRRRKIPLDDSSAGLARVDQAIEIVEAFANENAKKHAAYRLFRSTSSKERILELIDSITTPSMKNPRQLNLNL